jgi:pimeloyl-ACP methyl ester carboxylesterase
MQRRTFAAIVLALVLLLLLAVAGWFVIGGSGEDNPGSASGARPAVPRGPEGPQFYDPPQDRIAGEPGTLIWANRITVGPTLPGGRTWRVLYRSVGGKGEPIAVSGLITVPVGAAAKNSRPVLSWGHGTTGAADQCAPSKTRLTDGTGLYLSTMDEMTSAFVERGWVVTRTDYEGLGTPGEHAYLMGTSAGRSMVDIVRAARHLDPSAGPRWLAAGHSQGGAAALWAAASPASWAPELDLRGAIALSPPSDMAEIMRVAPGLPLGATPFLALLIHGVKAVSDVPTDALLTAKGKALYPLTDERCIAGIMANDALAPVPTSTFFDKAADFSAFRKVLAENDATAIKPRVPVLLRHGSKDITVPPDFTDRLAQRYRAEGVDLDFSRIPQADHLGAIAAALPAALAFADARMR